MSTDTDGVACSNKVRESRYRVDVWKPGFLHASFQPVSVHPEAQSRLRVFLPFGEIREGGISQRSLVSGTLTDEKGPVEDARICVRIPKTAMPLACVETNSLGEYTISLSPGEYVVEIIKGSKRARPIDLSLTTSGVFRNKLNLVWMKGLK